MAKLSTILTMSTTEVSPILFNGIDSQENVFYSLFSLQTTFF